MVSSQGNKGNYLTSIITFSTLGDVATLPASQNVTFNKRARKNGGPCFLVSTRTPSCDSLSLR